MDKGGMTPRSLRASSRPVCTQAGPNSHARAAPACQTPWHSHPSSNWFRTQPQSLVSHPPSPDLPEHPASPARGPGGAQYPEVHAPVTESGARGMGVRYQGLGSTWVPVEAGLEMSPSDLSSGYLTAKGLLRLHSNFSCCQGRGNAVSTETLTGAPLTRAQAPLTWHCLRVPRAGV